MKTFKCTPIKDKSGLINIDVTEIYNLEDPSERYPAGFNQWKVGESIQEQDILFYEGFVYNRLFLR